MILSRRNLIASGILAASELGWAGSAESVSGFLESPRQADSATAPPLLSTGLLAGTVAVPKVDDAVEAYCKWFNYVVRWRGKVTKEQAALWGASKVAGHPVAVIGLPDTEVGLIRFVGSAVKPAPAFTTIGWTSLEIRVRDVDKLIARLEGSPFKRIGGPGNARLGTGPEFRRSMQTSGLAGEVIYFTANATSPDAPSPGGLLGVENTGNVFILVLASRHYQETRQFYAQVLGSQSGPGRAFALSIANLPLGLPRDNPINLVAARVGVDSLIEIDDFPKEAAPRVFPPGELSPGVSMETLAIADLDKVTSALQKANVEFRRLDAGLPGPPYRGGRALVCLGPSGEMHEFIERKDPWPARSSSG